MKAGDFIRNASLLTQINDLEDRLATGQYMLVLEVWVPETDETEVIRLTLNNSVRTLWVNAAIGSRIKEIHQDSCNLQLQLQREWGQVLWQIEDGNCTQVLSEVVV